MRRPISPQVLEEQARLLREIQHLNTAAHLLAIGKPERARASEAAKDLAKARQAQLLPETLELLLEWIAPENAQVWPEVSDHGDRLMHIWAKRLPNP